MFTKRVFGIIKSVFSRKMSSYKVIDTDTIEKSLYKIIPALTEDKHKGQAGRIGVVGGSLEYTGAPFFAAITALKVGADLSHVFCTKEAAPVIKSYSPELIVHPLLDNDVEKIMPWLERLHVLVIGPGLGRDEKIFQNVEGLINICRLLQKPLVIDADGLFLISKKPDLIKNYPGIILTPNVLEYKRLFNTDQPNILGMFGDKCIVIKKGQTDEIFDSTSKTLCSIKGSARRCGGQGDLLSGSVAVFYYWASLQEPIVFLENKNLNPILAAYAACKLTRKCNERAFKQKARSMTASDMIENIGTVFANNFELH